MYSSLLATTGKKRVSGKYREMSAAKNAGAVAGAVRVRPAEKEDCQEIVRLIQDLADYEKMPDGPKIGAKTLMEDGFPSDGGDRFFHCLVAEEEERRDDKRALIGYCLFFYTYSTWEGRSVYMEDIYVSPEHRGRGAGKAMWKQLVKTALDKRCTRCNFSVLSWNAPSIAFYKAHGAVDLTESEGWNSFRLDKEAMEKLVQDSA